MIVTIILALIIDHLFTFIDLFISPYSLKLLSSVLLFHFAGCPWADYSVTNSFSSCFSESLILIYSSLLKDSFVNIGFFVDGFFPFSTLNLFAPLFWCPEFFYKKVADHLIDDPLDVTSHLSLADFRTLSLSLSFESLIIVSLNMSLSLVHLPWRLLSFLDLYIHVFHHIWVVFSQYFFKYSLCFFGSVHFF